MERASNDRIKSLSKKKKNKASEVNSQLKFCTHKTTKIEDLRWSFSSKKRGSMRRRKNKQISPFYRRRKGKKKEHPLMRRGISARLSSSSSAVHNTAKKAIQREANCPVVFGRHCCPDRPNIANSDTKKTCEKTVPSSSSSSLHFAPILPQSFVLFFCY